LRSFSSARAIISDGREGRIREAGERRERLITPHVAGLRIVFNGLRYILPLRDAEGADGNGLIQLHGHDHNRIGAFVDLGRDDTDSNDPQASRHQGLEGLLTRRVAG
jgi:hypothetical protein